MSSRRRSLVTRPVATAALAALAFAAGCAPSPDRASGDAAGAATATTPRTPPPAVEFLVTAGDSTFWVRTGPWGASVRGAPLTLARYGGRFYEIYVGDDDRSFYDAVFVGQRVFRRDIVSGDSALVFADSAVLRAARRYAQAHPDETPLGDDEDASDDPRVSFTSDVELLDALGPFLTYDFRTRREVHGDLEDAAARRGVIDLRTGRAATVADVVGSGPRAAGILRQGRLLFAAALDSVRHAHDERALAAQRALAGFVFDPASFAFVDVAGAPAIAFVALGRGDEAAGYTLPLPPVVVDPAPAWWGEVRASLADADSVEGDDADRWHRRDADVTARYDSESGAYSLLLQAPAGHGKRGDWPIGRLQGPVRQLYWLDTPAMDSTVRRALARAFDESALYSDEARTVGWRRAERGTTGWRWAVSGGRERAVDSARRTAVAGSRAHRKGDARRRAPNRL